MKTVTINLAEAVFQLEAEAEQTSREPADVIREFLQREIEARPAPTHSVLDIKSYPLGPPNQPWTCRAEMLE